MRLLVFMDRKLEQLLEKELVERRFNKDLRDDFIHKFIRIGGVTFIGYEVLKTLNSHPQLYESIKNYVSNLF